jgi:PAS domain S-box-containing protein
MTDEDGGLVDFGETEYRALIEYTSDVITVVAPDGTVKYQSPSAEHVKGWKPEEMVGDNILEYIHPEDRSRVTEEFAVLTEGEGFIEKELEFRFETKEEGWIWLATTGTAPGQESPIDGYITASRDITERKKYEQKLAADRKFLDRVIESLPYPFYVLDAEDYSIVHANDRAIASEGDTCYEVTHGRDRPCDEGENTAPCPIEEVEAADKPVSVQHVHPDEDGNERIFELHAAPITDEDGNVTQIAESNIDITDRVAYERRLEDQRDNLELLNQIVRHDIRNDLQVISAYAETLTDYVEDDAKEYLLKILEASRDAVEITETARDVTEVMIQSEADVSPVGLRSVLESEVSEVRSNYDNALVTVDGATPSVQVLADDMLGSVFRNLLTNAVQHNDKEVPEVTVSTEERDDTALVKVADNGPGIADERKAEIFEEGERGLDSSGTGLGLYLVDTLVERYGGDIRVEDNDPQGTVFAVSLPLAE